MLQPSAGKRMEDDIVGVLKHGSHGRSATCKCRATGYLIQVKAKCGDSC